MNWEAVTRWVRRRGRDIEAALVLAIAILIGEHETGRALWRWRYVVPEEARKRITAYDLERGVHSRHADQGRGHPGD